MRLREIKAFRPRLIVTVGSNASNFILRRAQPKVEDWRELFWNELKALIQDKLPDLPTIYGAKVFTLMHLSRANPANYFNRKLKSLIKRLLEAYL